MRSLISLRTFSSSLGSTLRLLILVSRRFWTSVLSWPPDSFKRLRISRVCFAVFSSVSFLSRSNSFMIVFCPSRERPFRSLSRLSWGDFLNLIKRFSLIMAVY